MADFNSDAERRFKALLNLQVSTEKLLLQLDIPDEICKKYFALRDGTYAAIGIKSEFILQAMSQEATSQDD